jgi:hypothetical protein
MVNFLYYVPVAPKIFKNGLQNASYENASLENFLKVAISIAEGFLKAARGHGKTFPKATGIENLPSYSFE